MLVVMKLAHISLAKEAVAVISNLHREGALSDGRHALWMLYAALSKVCLPSGLAIGMMPLGLSASSIR